MRGFALAILLLFLQTGFCQRNKPSFLTATYTEGVLVAHRANMHHLVRKNNRGVDLSCMWQWTDDSQMTRLYGKPQMGIAASYRNFGYDEVLGNGFGISYVMQFPLWQSKNNLVLDFRSETGLGFVTKKYDKETNPKNNAIGRHLNLKPVLELRLTKYHKKIHYGMGLAFTHFSNGATRQPNLGLNTLYASLNLGYNLQERQMADKKPTFKERKEMEDDFSNHSLYGEVVVSARQVGDIPYDGKLYPVVSYRTTYVYRPRIKWGWDISLDLVYNAANPNLWPSEEHKQIEGFQVGIYTGAQVYFYRAVILFGLGVYAFDPSNANGPIYDRLGLQYYLNDKIYALLSIKANYAKAEYFELGIGYRLKGW